MKWNLFCRMYARVYIKYGVNIWMSLYNVHCTQCTLYSDIRNNGIHIVGINTIIFVVCTLYNVQCTLYNVKSTLYTVLNSVHCTYYYWRF